MSTHKNSLQNYSGMNSFLGLGCSWPFGLKAPSWENFYAHNKKRSLDQETDFHKFKSKIPSLLSQFSNCPKSLDLIPGKVALIPSDLMEEDATSTYPNQKRNKIHTNQTHNSNHSIHTAFDVTHISALSSCSNELNKVDISISTNSMHQSRNKIYSLTRSVNGSPILCREAKLVQFP